MFPIHILHCKHFWFQKRASFRIDTTTTATWNFCKNFFHFLKKRIAKFWLLGIFQIGEEIIKIKSCKSLPSFWNATVGNKNVHSVFVQRYYIYSTTCESCISRRYYNFWFYQKFITIAVTTLLKRLWVKLTTVHIITQIIQNGTKNSVCLWERYLSIKLVSINDNFLLVFP